MIYQEYGTVNDEFFCGAVPVLPGEDDGALLGVVADLGADPAAAVVGWLAAVGERGRVKQVVVERFEAGRESHDGRTEHAPAVTQRHHDVRVHCNGGGGKRRALSHVLALYRYTRLGSNLGY